MQRTGFVHQIAISSCGGRPELSGYLREAVESVRTAFPQREHRLWYHDEGAKFIRNHFGPTVAWAFNTLRPYAYKADLLKYCLLYQRGGWVIDLGVTMLEPPEPLIGREPDFVLFRETGGWSAPWNVSLACLYARPGSPVFTRAIREVVRNCARHHYGANPICPTLTVLGRALAVEDVQERHMTGIAVNVEGRPYSRAYELPRHGFIATRKPKEFRGGQLGGLGLAGTNSYVEMWRKRTVYANIRPPNPFLAPTWAKGVVRQQVDGAYRRMRGAMSRVRRTAAQLFRR